MRRVAANTPLLLGAAIVAAVLAIALFHPWLFHPWPCTFPGLW